MNQFIQRINKRMVTRSLLAVLIILLVTGVLLFIKEQMLGEAIVALLYLLPVIWIAAYWGRIPGIIAAITAALNFDFFFFPPYYSLNIYNFKDWLVVIIFLTVALVIVSRIRSIVSKAWSHEQNAIFMYELIASIATLQNRSDIAQKLATRLQQGFQAELVQVSLYRYKQQSVLTTSSPSELILNRWPDRVFPIKSGDKFFGKILVWQGELLLPPEDDWLVQSLENQTALTLERIEILNGEIPLPNAQS
jgi:K+-sensing histidine kinase KdpD